jgi:hypothetical protein
MRVGFLGLGIMGRRMAQVLQNVRRSIFLSAAVLGTGAPCAIPMHDRASVRHIGGRPPFAKQHARWYAATWMTQPCTHVPRVETRSWYGTVRPARQQTSSRQVHSCLLGRRRCEKQVG